MQKLLKIYSTAVHTIYYKLFKTSDKQPRLQNERLKGAETKILAPQLVLSNLQLR